MFVADYHTLQQLQDLAQAIPQKRLWRRVQAVLLAKQGRTAEDIAQALGCSLRAVKNWVTQYNRGDIAALHERARSGRPPRLDPQEYPRLRQRLDAPPRPEDGACTLRGGDVQRILGQEFGAAMGLQTVYDLLHRIAYSSLMPRPQHEEANPEVQAFFKEIVVEQIEAIAEAHPDQEIRTFFQDEARFGQKGTITRVWAPQGVASPCRASAPLHLLVRAGGRLHEHRGDRGVDHAGAECGGAQPVPGATVGGVARRGAYGPDLGRCRLPYQ